jgi:hypothetical protein
MPNALCPITLRIPAFLASEICHKTGAFVGGERADLVVASNGGLAKGSHKKKTGHLGRVSAVVVTSRQRLLIGLSLSLRGQELVIDI